MIAVTAEISDHSYRGIKVIHSHSPPYCIVFSISTPSPWPPKKNQFPISMKFILRPICLLLITAFPLFASIERVSVIKNGDFEQGSALPLEWEANPRPVNAEFTRDTVVKHSGKASGRIITVNTNQQGWPAWEQKIKEVKEGQRYEARVWIKTEASPSTMAYLSMDCFGSNGKRMSFIMSRAVYGSSDWVEFSIQDNIPANTVSVTCRIILHGPGTAWFDDISVVRVDGWEAEPRIKSELVQLRPTGVVYNKNFGGFGAEIDPWLWNEVNQSKGVTEADTKLISARVQEMRLSIARVMINRMSFNPSEDLRTFTWDNDSMRSLENTLQLCQTNNIEVVLCPVEFGSRQRKLWDGATNKGPEEAVKSWSTAVEYLVKNKGFTCIRWLQLCNEPDFAWIKRFGYSFDDYVRINELMFAELNSRQLPVSLLGSGDAESLQWFVDSVRRTSAFVGGYGGSRYAANLNLEEVRDRNIAYLAAMRTNDPAWSEKKYIVTEFGIRAQATTDKHNAYMRTFDCGLGMADLCLDQVALGVDAASIWCLHRIYYSSDNLMDYGLWEFKDENWKPRPLWYSYSLFTRFMTRGSQLSQIDVKDGEGLVKATLAQGPEGRFLFVLNQSYGDITIAADTGSLHGRWARYTYDERIKQASADRPLFEQGPATPYDGEIHDRIPRRSLVVYQLW